jgi:hypothetical protein
MQELQTEMSEKIVDFCCDSLIFELLQAVDLSNNKLEQLRAKQPNPVYSSKQHRALLLHANYIGQ